MSVQTVLHLVYRFDIGGLETVMVNMINSLPEGQFQHVIVSLTDANPEFAGKLKHEVKIVQLHKPAGNSIKVHFQLWRLFRQFRPDIVHSYNIACLEYQSIAFFSGVKYRIHAEHGRDIYDLDGSNRKYQILRRLLNPFIHYWTPVSDELRYWLIDTVKIPAEKVKRIYNGIDIDLYRPKSQSSNPVFKVTAVGRLVAVKDQLTLIKAVQYLVDLQPERRAKLSLSIIGDGELGSKLQSYVIEHEIQDFIHLPGASQFVASILQETDLFVLPSLAEGIALTILEAMATALPIITTRVGGNPELIEQGVNGQLVESGNFQQIAEVIIEYMDNPDLCLQHGKAGRAKAESLFSLQAMSKNYLELYQSFITH